MDSGIVCCVIKFCNWLEVDSFLLSLYFIYICSDVGWYSDGLVMMCCIVW